MIRLIIWCKPFSKYFLAVLTLAIIIVSSIPSIPTLTIHTAKADIRLDYLMHFGEYGVLTFLTFLSFTGNEYKVSYKTFFLIVPSLILFALLDEYHQKLIPGRLFNIKDILSNITGILAALIFTFIVFRIIAGRIRINETDSRYQHKST